MLMKRKGQTALEYMLMLVVVLALLVIVIWMTNVIVGVGSIVGSVVGDVRTQVVAWLMT